MSQRTCDQLGVCQAKFPFAPGVITHEPSRSHLGHRRAVRCVVRILGTLAAVVAAFAVSGLLGLALGVFAKWL